MSSLIVFLKAQMSAFIGGVTDYLIMIICTELFGIHYTISIVISGVLGAVVNFSINKYWTFEAKAPLGKQISKFIIVVLGSVFFKSGGTYLVTEFRAIDYRISRLLIELFVSLGFNYPMQKYWVFKKQKTHI
ncbi:MAG TPA: GtrA family protein [Sphingobacterium sp.]|nr:GtrA family protein [Sphingobacterium sp.]